MRRALALAPDDRYPTAQALQLDIEAFARAHGLVLSTVGLGEYMHTLFAHRIAEWQRAQQSGKSLKQHLAEVEAASARLEPSSQPTATDLHALSPERAARRRARRTPAFAAAALALALAGGVTAALQFQIGGRRSETADQRSERADQRSERADQRSARAERIARAHAGAGAQMGAGASASTSTTAPALAGTQSPTAPIARAEAAPAKPSTAPRAGNTVESHLESLSASNATKPKRAPRPRAAGAEVDPPTTPASVDPDRGAAPPPAPAHARSNALKEWDPDSPIPP